LAESNLYRRRKSGVKLRIECRGVMVPGTISSRMSIFFLTLKMNLIILLSIGWEALFGGNGKRADLKYSLPFFVVNFRPFHNYLGLVFNFELQFLQYPELPPVPWVWSPRAATP